MENYLNKALPIKKRKELFKTSREKMMNPIPMEDFNPDNFEPLATVEEKEVLDRIRKVPPKELPTFGIKPKEIRVGQMVGMYESKQDIYLTFAWRCNELQREIDLLKKQIK